MSKKPYFMAVGSVVEDVREDRPDICQVYLAQGKQSVKRSYDEACRLAQQIADAMNRLYPDANKAGSK
jgi:hypothetical protein